MSEKNDINVFIIDRSDPHEVIAISSKGEKITRLDELRRGMFLRRDIALVNVLTECPTCGHKTYLRQYDVYATKSGEPCGSGWNYLNDEQKEECREINRKLIEVAKLYPEMRHYLQ